MATSAQYATTPTVDISQISTANTNRDGTGTLVEIASGPSVAQGSGVGKRISTVVICATGTTTQNMIRFFLSTDGGTTKRLIGEVVTAPLTPSGTVPAYQAVVPFLSGLILQGQVSSNSCKLYASTHAAETYNIFVFGGNF